MLQDTVADMNHLDDSFGKASALEDTAGLPVICGLCGNPFTDPLILTCLHIFDRKCLVKREERGEVTYVKCPRCDGLSGGVSTLESFDASIAEGPQVKQSSGAAVQCSVCTEGLEALYRCIHCAGTLCERCREIHKVMKCFSRHEVLDLTEEEKKDIAILQRNMQNTKPVPCQTHPENFYTSFCVQCHVPLCDICYESEHKTHINSGLDLIPDHVGSLLSGLIEGCVDKQEELRQLSDNLHSFLSDLSTSRDRNQAAINEAYDKWKNTLDSIRDNFLQRNREIHCSFEMKLWSRIHTIGKTLEHTEFACEFSKSYLGKCSNIDMCKLTKSVLACLDRLSKSKFSNELPTKISFLPTVLNVSDLTNQFGNFDITNESGHRSDEFFHSFGRSPTQAGNGNASGDISEELKCISLKDGANGSAMLPIDGTSISQLTSVSPTNSQCSNRALSVGNMQVTNGFDAFITRSNEPCNAIKTPLTSWSDLSGNVKAIEQHDYISNVNHIDNSFMSYPFVPRDIGQSMMRPINANVCTPNAELNQKQKMPVNYNATLFEYCRLRSARSSQMTLLTKWGSLGCELGRLSSPHGFCLGFDEQIVVADTYNHRIQIFTKCGSYVSYFGVSGRVDGLLWYPRKVAIIRQSQRYVVCDRGNERSRMQLFSRSGHFVRRIPIRYIDIVAGLAINQHGHIVAIDSVSPSVFVVSEDGELIRWFDCSNYMREPSDVAIHGREYYICDFKAHCVIVFQEDGTFLRRIGGESITDFPNGIDVSNHGDVLVGDSHGNRFHIAVFSRNGDLLSEFVFSQSKVSRSCCLKITTEGYVVTLARSSNNVLVMDTLYIC